MFIAHNSIGERIQAENAVRSEEYFCPVCNGRVRLKTGEHKKAHFAHYSTADCNDKWSYDMSPWHIAWQEKYPVENREVVMDDGVERHRADVCIGKYVIEFQHSNLSSHEFDERNQFYNRCGYKVIWLFDVIDKYENGKILFEGNRGLYTNKKEFQWKHASKTMSSILPQKSTDVIICLQITDSDILHVVEAERERYDLEKASYRYFYTSDNHIETLSEESIDNMVKYIQTQIEIEKQIEQDRQIEIEQKKQINLKVGKGLFDAVEYYIGRNNIEYIYPCFLEKEKTGRLYANACTFCIYCGMCGEKSGCTYRFKDIEIRNIGKIVRDKNGYITDIIFKDGKVKKYEKVDPRLYTIEELWNSYGGDMLDVMRCVNISTGNYAQIKMSPSEQLKKFGSIKGRISSDGIHYHGFFEIFRADKKEWKMEWFVDKTKK